MNGLDKMIAQILDDADKEAKEILAAAKQEADSIRAEAEESVKKLTGEKAEQARQMEAGHMERVKSSAELKKRQAILLAKQQVISGMLERVHTALLQQEDGEYFAMLGRMAEQFATDKEGAIYLSEKDLNRLPEDFEAVLGNAAAAKGGSLKLVKEPKAIDGGFILVYGGMEENCSFKSLLASRRDELSDKIHALLFS